MIGSSPRRKEDQRLLTGHGRFVDDLARDGTLHLGVVRSTEAHARITKVSTAAARALPGVALAWSAADLGAIAPNMPTAYGGTQKGRGWAQPVLARDVVRHVGEPVAVVVAESAYQLADALDAVTVAYEPLPVLPTAESSLASGARLHEGWPDNTAIVARGAGRGGRSRAGHGRRARGPARAPAPSAAQRDADRDARRARLSRPELRRARRIVVDPEPIHPARRGGRGARPARRGGPRRRPGR